MATKASGARPRAYTPEMRDQVGTATKTPGWDLAVERRLDDGEALANAMGWFSLGLGALELAAPGRLARYLGMEDRTNLVRLYGVREFGKGIGILSSRKPVGWMWARIAGDVLDLATLAGGLTRRNRRRRRVLGAIVAVAGATALDMLAVRQLTQSRYQPSTQTDRVRAKDSAPQGAR
jgi:hypothetical protein